MATTTRLSNVRGAGPAIEWELKNCKPNQNVWNWHGPHSSSRKMKAIDALKSFSMWEQIDIVKRFYNYKQSNLLDNSHWEVPQKKGRKKEKMRLSRCQDLVASKFLFFLFVSLVLPQANAQGCSNQCPPINAGQGEVMALCEGDQIGTFAFRKTEQNFTDWNKRSICILIWNNSVHMHS